MCPPALRPPRAWRRRSRFLSRPDGPCRSPSSRRPSLRRLKPAAPLDAALRKCDDVCAPPTAIFLETGGVRCPQTFEPFLAAVMRANVGLHLAPSTALVRLPVLSYTYAVWQLSASVTLVIALLVGSLSVSQRPAPVRVASLPHAHRAAPRPRPHSVCGRSHDVRPASPAVTRTHRARAAQFAIASPNGAPEWPFSTCGSMPAVSAPPASLHRGHHARPARLGATLCRTRADLEEEVDLSPRKRAPRTHSICTSSARALAAYVFE